LPTQNGIKLNQTVDLTSGQSIACSDKTGFSLSRPTGAVVADAGNSATTFKTNLSSSTNDYIKDAYVKFTSGNNLNEVKKIMVYDGTSKFVTTQAFTNVPSGSDTFIIINE
jgi:hypothetical protein